MNKTVNDLGTGKSCIISLVGNPNVGKSSVFNALTGLHQHTGNWPGKTVAVAHGHYEYKGKRYTLIDLPGTYSLTACSEEERIARDFILSEQSDCTVVIGDATCLERNLYLLLQVLATGQPTVFCVNLMDEAKRKGIEVDLDCLERKLGIPVIGTSATSGEGLDRLKEKVRNLWDGFLPSPKREIILPDDEKERARELADQAEKLCCAVCRKPKNSKLHWFDRIALGKGAGQLLMLLLLLGTFWLTIQGANYPSSLLQSGFEWFKPYLHAWTVWWPAWLSGILIDGVYETVSKVVAVMLPPMAIFFPMFTLLEDIGYLPRAAFLMDHAFEQCGSCGKQSLTMAMGFGCNAAGVVGCRIISSKRERLIAILTNALVPCNGRFPTLIVLISLFFSQNSLVGAAILTGLVLLSTGVTFWVSKFLSSTLLRGEDSHFVLEIPPYRKPKVCRILIRALLDRTIYVLGRAVVVAAPAGAIIWLMQTIHVNGIPLLTHFAEWLNPVGHFFGMNGVILAAFLLSFPANELFLPLIVMITQETMGSFEAASATVGTVLMESGWNWKLAMITIIFVLFHWPCSTTCLTIQKETRSWKWTLVSILLPTIVGLFLCFILSYIV